MGSASTSASANETGLTSVQVKWVGGGVDIFRDIEVNRLITLVEGSGLAVEADAPRSP
jgi:hypothetical protein